MRYTNSRLLYFTLRALAITPPRNIWVRRPNAINSQRNPHCSVVLSANNTTSLRWFIDTDKKTSQKTKQNTCRLNTTRKLILLSHADPPQTPGPSGEIFWFPILKKGSNINRIFCLTRRQTTAVVNTWPSSHYRCWKPSKLVCNNYRQWCWQHLW